MAPRGSSIGASSPTRAASHPAVVRRLDFEQDDGESSLQETPALSGSGQRRGKRMNVYDIPEDGSPLPQASTVFEESFVQEEITVNEDSVLLHGVAEESSIAQIGDNTSIAAEAVEDLVDLEDSGVMPEPVIEPPKRGRKRKSDVLKFVDEPSNATMSGKRSAASAHTSEVQKKVKKTAPAPAPTSRRSKRVSDIMEQESSALDASLHNYAHAVEEQEETRPPPKRRGRPARPKPVVETEISVPSKSAKNVATKADGAFKKPPKPVAKSKEQSVARGRLEAKVKASNQPPQITEMDPGKLVDVHGHPLSKKEIEQMSTTSVGSRYGRGRHLSVFRELEPEAVARIGRTGRHRVAPIDFWKNDRIAYDPSGSMTSIVMNQDTEPERKSYKVSGAKGKKRSLMAIEEEEIELDPWEEEDGVLVGNYRDFDPVTDVTSNDIIEDSMLHQSYTMHSGFFNNIAEIAWAHKGILPVDVPDGSFQYTKLASVGSFFNWGLIELRADQMKRTKNSRKMHMVFNVQSGTVEVKVHENEFTVHKGGIWQVPRGEQYIFFHSSVALWPAKLSYQFVPRLIATVGTQIICPDRYIAQISYNDESLNASTRAEMLSVSTAATTRNARTLRHATPYRWVQGQAKRDNTS
jgi:centromere protein C